MPNPSSLSSPGARSSQPTRFRGWIFRLSLVGPTIVIALLVGEITVRWLGLAEPWRPPNPTALFLYHEDPNGPIEMAPNWEGYISFHEEPVRLNRDGFRDREFPANPPPGTTRIAVVGDGYTMGDGIGRGYTYAKQLEEILGRSLSCEVMNCGVTATNSHNQLPIVRRLLADFHPQVIALCYNFNDFSYRRTTFFEDLGPSGFDYVVNRDRTVTITETDLGPRRVLNRKLKQNSHLYRVLRLLRFRPTSQSPRESVQGWIRDEGHLKSFDAVAPPRAWTRFPWAAAI